MDYRNINIRLSTGRVFQVQVDIKATTVQGLKELIANEMSDAESANLTLVFAGRILNGQDSLEDNKITNGCTIHVVCSGMNKTMSRQQSASEPNEQIKHTPPRSRFTETDYYVSSNGLPVVDSEFIDRVMESPIMQSIMENPEILRYFIMSRPRLRAMVERFPVCEHIIKDPSFIRRSLERMRNPDLTKEMQRHNDRVLFNMEATPEGFDYMLSMYNTTEDFLGPLLGLENHAEDNANNERLARQLNVQSLPEQSLNTQPLPNPWTINSTATELSPTSIDSIYELEGSESTVGSPVWEDQDLPQASPRMQQSVSSQQNVSQKLGLFQQLPIKDPATCDPSEPPEVRFRNQLVQLQEMGFSEEPKNIFALLVTEGDVQAAIEYLLLL